MTPRTTHLVLAMFFTLVCTLSAAGATIPSAIAQEEDTASLDEDLARSIISDVLDVSGDDEEENDDAADDEIVAQHSTDTTTANPTQEDQTVDQTDFNEFGDNTAVSIDIDKDEQPTPPPDDGLPSEDVIFCFEKGLILGILCSDTPEDCEFAQELFENIISECEAFERPPPGTAFCSVSEGREIIRCESRN